MTELPPHTTPLYHHSLPALEGWLSSLGARRDPQNSSLWLLEQADWRATIELKVEGLKVVWTQGSRLNQRLFSYGLTRSDVEAAIQTGP